MSTKADASGPPRVATLPWFEAPEPTASHTIIGIGVGEPTVVSTRWVHQAPTLKLVAVPEALQEPTVARLPTSTPVHRKPRAALVPRLVPALAQSAAPALLGQMPVPEREVFELARRIALQADLPAAMRVLHHGLSRLTDSSDVMCVFFDVALCSPWVLPDGRAGRGLDDHVRQLVAQVAGSGRRAVLGHVLIEPVGPAPARGVFLVRRPPTSMVYGQLEIATVAAIAAALCGLIGHFVAEHVALREQARRDARSLLRPETLAARRGAPGAPGRVVATARTWIRWAYPALIGLVAAVIVAAAIVQVPTYSTGVSFITVEGEPVTSPMAGTVTEVMVAPDAQVAAGDPLLRLRAPEGDAELVATEAVDDRILRASSAGVVSHIGVRPGQLVTPGAPIMKISPSTDPSIVALLPGSDRARLEVGMTLQIELTGYHKKREQAVIDAIDSRVIGPEEARKTFGDPIGDALPVTGPVVILHAHLTARTFEAGGRTYEFRDGMLGKAEVRLDHQSLLSVLLHGKRK
jgi:hypothetical protein